MFKIILSSHSKKVLGSDTHWLVCALCYLHVLPATQVVMVAINIQYYNIMVDFTKHISHAFLMFCDAAKAKYKNTTVYKTLFCVWQWFSNWKYTRNNTCFMLFSWTTAIYYIHCSLEISLTPFHLVVTQGRAYLHLVHLTTCWQERGVSKTIANPSKTH